MNWSSHWDLLLVLLQTLVAPLHWNVLAVWRSQAWHLVELQEEVQEAGMALVEVQEEVQEAGMA